MANVILSISARNRAKRTLNEIRQSIESTIRVNMRGSFESERAFTSQIQLTKRYLQEQERSRNAYVKFWQDGLRAQERAEAAEARSRRIERAREFNRILRDSTIISERAAREIANDYSDIEGALGKSLRAYQRQQNAIERTRRSQERSRISLRALFQTVADGVFVFREFSFWIQRIGSDLVQTGVFMDSLRRSLAIFADETESADSILENVFELAELPGITIEGASKAVQDLRAINLEADLVNRTITEFGNLLALTGDSDFSGILLGFKQIINRQRVSQEELNQIIERSGLAAKALQEAFGFATSEEIQGVVDASGGDIVDNFVRPFLAELERLERFPVDAAATRIKNLNNEFFRLRAELGDELLPTISAATKGLTDFLQDGGIDAIAGGFRFLLSAVGPATAGVATFAGARGLGALIARGDDVLAFLRGAPAGLANFARAYGPALAATAAVTAATALWTQTLEENRRARELGQQVNEDYAASIRSLASAFEDGQIDVEESGAILETLNRNIAEYAQSRTEVGGFFSDLNPFDNRAIESQLASLDELTQNAEELRSVVIELQRGRISQEEGRGQLLGLSAEGLKEVRVEIERIQERIGLQHSSQTQVIEQLNAELTRYQAQETTLQNIVNLIQERNQALAQPTPAAQGESATDLSVSIAREEDTLRRLRDSLSDAAVGDISDVQTQAQQSLSRLTELRRRHARVTVDDADRLRVQLTQLELRTLREIDAIRESARAREQSFRDAEAKVRIQRETNTQKAIAARIQAENRRQAAALKDFIAVREALSRSEQEFLDSTTGALVRQGTAFDVAYQQATRFISLTDTVSAIPERFNTGVINLNIGLARMRGLIQEASEQVTSFFRSEGGPDVFERAGADIGFGRSVAERFPPGAFGPSVEDDQVEVGREGRSFLLDQLNSESEEALRRQQQTVTRVVSQTQQALVDIVSGSSDSWIENIKRVVTSFVASSASMIVQSRIQYEIQKFYDDKLTESKIANLQRLQAVTATSSVVGTGLQAGAGVLGNPLALLGAIPQVVNLLQIGDSEVREITSVQRRQRAERTDF